jgi:hypothetical protein
MYGDLFNRYWFHTYCDPYFPEKVVVALSLLAAYFFLLAAACFYGFLHSLRSRNSSQLLD